MQWRDQELRDRQLPAHLVEHLPTMAKLRAANRFNRLAPDVEALTGSLTASVREFVARNAESFAWRAATVCLPFSCVRRWKGR